MFLEALDKGADIYGVDISPSMIRKLKIKLKKENRDRVQVQDAVKLNLDRKFALVLAPFRVFSHILSTSDQITCLNRIHNHLEESGRLIFDLFVPNLDLIQKGMKDQKDFDGEFEPGKKVTRTVCARSDLIKQITTVSMTFTWNEKGKEIKRTWEFPMRFYFRYEIEHMLARSRFSQWTLYGDFQENPLNEQSKEFIVCCQK